MSRKLYRTLYRIGVGAYFGAIHLVSPFHAKAKAMVEGRKGVLDTIRNKRKEGDQWVMIHTSSVGEFEQARPIIEWFRQEHPELKICLTFFSSSGYNAYRNYSQADIVTYLPFDNSSHLQEFIELLHPKMVLIIKYEFWLRTIDLFHRNHIPIFLISAIFREDQPFFKKGYGSIFREALSQIDTIFIQNEKSAHLLQTIGATNYVISGDTRMDRVVQIKEKGVDLPEFSALREAVHNAGKKVLVAGSTWKADEQLLLRYAEENEDEIFLILVPHEIDETHIKHITEHSPLPVTSITQWDGQSPEKLKLLLVDKIGLLSKLYKYADVAYIGGGFGKGIHNTIEASVYGIPVLFGPKYHKFREAKKLLKNGGGFSISSYQELSDQLNKLLEHPELLEKSGKVAQEMVYSNIGATKVVVDQLSDRL